jgi:hypothetical protein
MFTDVRRRHRYRRQKASTIRSIEAASQPQRDELIVMAQRHGLM